MERPTVPEIEELPAEETRPSSGKRTTVPPLNALAILKKETGPDVMSLGFDEVCRRLYSGILLYDKDKNIKAQKFWVDEKLNKNCFLVLCKAMNITFSEDRRYWEYKDDEEKWFDGVAIIQVAKLKGVCWLEAKGKFGTMVLSPKTMYEVAFVVKMSKENDGWHLPVTVNMSLPDGSKQGRSENLSNKPTEKWFTIPVGSFQTVPKNVGEIGFELLGEGDHWKSGLIIRGVRLQALD